MANSLQLATNFLLFEQARIADPAASHALAEAAGRLSAVGQMHRFLSAHDAAASIDFEAFLSHLIGLIAGRTGLRCSIDADPVMLPAEVAQQLAIVVNELATNAAKHGRGPGEIGELHIESHVSDGRLRLIVSDDGEGLRRRGGDCPGNGLGMTIVAAILRQLEATLQIEDDHGAVFTISIPLRGDRPKLSRSFAPVD